MADTYSFTVGPVNATGTYGSNYAGCVEITQTPIDGTRSKIDWAFYIWWTVTSSSTTYHFANGNQVLVKIDGETEVENSNFGDVSLVGTSASNRLKLASGSTTVTHSADGTKDLVVYADYYQPNAAALNRITVSGTVTLEPTVTAASISSCPDLTLDGESGHTVGWTSASGSYYRVVYTYDGTTLHSSPVMTGTGSDMTYTWDDVPTSIAQDVSGTSMSVTATLYTYSDSAAASTVGSDSETFTVTFDSSAMAPYINEIILTDSDLLGTAFVGGKSSMEVEWTATGVGGASIASTSAKYCLYNTSTGAYTEISGTEVTTGSPATLPVFPNASFSSGGSVAAVKIVVTDSRGFSSTAYSSTWTVYKLTSPTIAALSLMRCDSSGTASASGAYFTATISYTIPSYGGQNEKHLGLSYYFSSDASTPASWTTPTISDPSEYSATITLGPYLLPTGSDDAVIALATCWDSYTASDKTEKTARILGTTVFMDTILDSDGNKASVSFGKVSDATGEAQFGWKVVAEDALEVVENKGTANETRILFDGWALKFLDANNNVRLQIDPDGFSGCDSNGANSFSGTWRSL